MIDNLAEKQGGSVVFWVIEKCLRIILFDNLTLIHENHTIGNRPGKTHFVGDAEHGHAGAGQINNNIKYLFDHFRIKCRSRFIKEHDLWIHAQTPGNGHSLLLSLGALARLLVRQIRNSHPFEILKS
jgi:hypothetical protein